MDDELIYQIALSRIKGLSPAMVQKILATMGSTREFFKLSDHTLSATLGVTPRLLTSEMRRKALEEGRAEMVYIENTQGVEPVFITSGRYPRRLLACQDAPLMLYASGKCDLNAQHVISIVGTRNATTYGVNFINRLIEELAERIDGLLIVSGLAMGCDVAAHKAALANKVPTVGIVAHGLDTLYPAEHRNVAARMVAEGGMVLTDYIHGTRPHRGNFLARNRLVAGISEATIVVESAADHGGALHTARLAAGYDRDVFALPGRNSDIYSGGCNKLIKMREANMIERADDLIDALGWSCRQRDMEQMPLFPTLSHDQQAIYDLIAHVGEMTTFPPGWEYLWAR